MATTRHFVHAWEEMATRAPDKVAIVSSSRHSYTYRELQASGHKMRDRLVGWGVCSGDRVMAHWPRHPDLSETISLVWACGLLGACLAPLWEGFSQKDLEGWNAVEDFDPRIIIDLNRNKHEIRPMAQPGEGLDALAWPMREREGCDRLLTGLSWDWISVQQVQEALSGLHESVSIGTAQSIGWMSSGVAPLPWLALFLALSLGVEVQEVPTISRKQSDIFEEWASFSKVNWLVTSPDWLESAGPALRQIRGVLAPWGVAMPHLRREWGSQVQWHEAWLPGGCGWWWGATRFQGPVPVGMEPLLPPSRFKWNVNQDGMLIITQDDGSCRALAYAYKVGKGARLSLSNLEDVDARSRWDVAMSAVRAYPRFGDCRAIHLKGQHMVVVVPRNHHESNVDVADEVCERLGGILGPNLLRGARVSAPSVFPGRDESGQVSVLLDRFALAGRD